MDSLIQDTLDYVREVAKTTPSLFATQAEIDYFAPRVYLPKKEIPKPPVQPLKKVVVEAPIIQAKVEEPLPTPLPPKPVVAMETKQLHEMRQVIEKTFPDMQLRDTILDDGHAKRMARLWEETHLSAQIVVIAFGEVGPGLEFLRNVTEAIDRLIAPAQLIEGAVLEKQQEWELLLNSPSLKGILCSPWASWKTTSLSQYYKQNGATQEQFLGKHKLFLLEPSLVYLKNPDRKRKLWQLISTQLLS